MSQFQSNNPPVESLLVILVPHRTSEDGHQAPCRIETVSALKTYAEEARASAPGAWLLVFNGSDRLIDDAVQRIRTAIDDSQEIDWLITDAALTADPSADSPDLHPIYQPDPDIFLLRSGFEPVGAVALRASSLATVLSDPLSSSLLDWRRWLTLRLLDTRTPGLHLAEILLIQAPTITSYANEAQPSDTTPALPAGLVSIVIPTRDQFPALQRCIESLFEHDPGAPFEIVLVSHRCEDPVTNAFINGLPSALPGRLRVTRFDGEFNFAELCNVGAALAQGDFLLFMNDDVAALHAGWLSELLLPMSCPQVGISAPRLVFPDGRIQHAGMVLGLNGAADFPFVGCTMDEPGPLGLLAYTREVSAVTGACLLVRRSLFDALKGFDTAYALTYADVDFCIRAARASQTCVWTPHATLMHEVGLTLKAAFATPQAAAGAQARFDQDKALLIKRWLPALARDPHYNPNLSLTSRRFEPEPNPALQPFSTSEVRHPRILALPADDNGSGEYRVAMPARAAAQQGLAASRIAPGYPLPVLLERLGVDTLFSQRQVDDNHIAALTALRELMPRLRIVMDFDDLLTGVSSQNYYYKTVWKDMPRRLSALAGLCDCFTVSTEPLAAAMRDYHPDVRVIPNGIDPAMWPARAARQRDPAPRRKLRVGWAGGYSHAGDLALIREVIAALANEVQWVFLGMCLEESRKHLHAFQPAVPFADYPAAFAALDLDLALAPLEINHFNECKSNLRLLENGILGYPVIATDIAPYRCGLPVTLVDNRPQSWIRAIRDRIGQQAALHQEGLALREAVLSDWTLEKTLPAWVSAWVG